MLRKYIGFVLRSPDANTEGASSNPSDDNGADSSQQQQDANQSDDQDGQQGSEGADNKGQSDDADDSSNDGAGDEGADDQQDGQQQQDDSANEDANVVLDKPEDKELEFHKHPRFQELIGQRREAVQQLEAVKPLVEQSRALNEFMTSNNIPPQELQMALQYLQLKRTDPQAAFRQLQGDYNALALLNGEVLPADLQAEVAAATISPERAKELAKMRGQSQYQSWQQQNGQFSSQQQVAQMVSAAANQWTSQKQLLDPDLKPGSPLWEQVQLRINAMPQYRSPQDVFAGNEKAYTEAKAFLSKLQPRTVTPNRRVNQHRSSSANSSAVVKSAEDVVRLLSSNGGRRPANIKYA